ncbi:TRAP transporter substrate-binding protein [Parvibium lacunae]|uniref:ABC transporter substrate-binding protein n=1 Tax=Parvibium lacunae TaxID=1888893 RepID=A0A368KZQ5_9BURK|nr:TRAP transporter substrate-binding protein [Parvibium lacunae]RCS56501.1 ABC transporter substrate-binding protein [Parvibium lacunae]
MERRSFLKQASTGAAAAAATTLAAPAIANEPSIKWRLASSFPKSLDTIYQAAEDMAKRVKELTDGKFDIRVFAAGEVVPAFGVADAVQNGTVEMAHTASYYFVGKNKTFCFDCAIPFGLTSRQQTAWMYHGGGLAATREFFREFNIINMPGGNTGTQMGGWWRKEIKSVEDLKGVKMRIPGFGGEVMSRLGVVPQAIPGGDIYPSLEKGTIDAAEWVGPYDDEKLGFFKVAPNYYYPGFWESSTQLSFYINAKEWEKLPATYKAALEAAAAEAHVKMQAEYDAKNPRALASLLAKGAKLHRYPNDVLAAAFKASQDLLAEENAKNPQFKKIFDQWNRFRNDSYQWFRVAEQGFAAFAFNQKV